MNVVRWSPFREFDNLFQALERPTAPMRRADWLPLVDIRETSEDYQIDVEVPAVASEDLAVNVSTLGLILCGHWRALWVRRRRQKNPKNISIPFVMRVKDNKKQLLISSSRDIGSLGTEPQHHVLLWPYSSRSEE